MDSTMILSARFGLLALLWVFIFLVMWTQRKDVVSAGGAVRRQASASAPAPREKARTLAVVEGPLQGSHMEIASLEDLTVGRAGRQRFPAGRRFRLLAPRAPVPQGQRLVRGGPGFAQRHLRQRGAH